MSRGVKSGLAAAVPRSPRLRVLHVTPYFAPAFRYGGPPRSVLGLCRGLQNVGVEVQVITTAADGTGELSPEVAGMHSFAGVPVHYLPRTFPKRYFNAKGCRDVLARHLPRVDLVHIHGCWNVLSWQAAHTCRAHAVPYVLSPRGMLEQWSFDRGKVRKAVALHLVEGRNLRSAACVHVTSDAEKASVRKLGVTTPVMCIPNGVECEAVTLPSADRQRFRSRYGIGAAEPLVLFLSRIHPKKGIEILAAAVGRVCERFPATRLVVAGDGEGDYVATITRRLRAQFGPRCILTGHLSDADKLAAYAAADVFALSSHSENFGLVVVEAMAAGLPVVVTRTCPWPDIETHGCGFWVAPDATAVAAALIEVLGDSDRGKEMGSRGRALVRAKYSWPVIARATAEQYERILQHRTACRKVS